MRRKTLVRLEKQDRCVKSFFFFSHKKENIAPSIVSTSKVIKIIKFYVSQAAEISSVPNCTFRCTDRMLQHHKVFSKFYSNCYK